jgi:2-dehydropantoate 2-reductase
VTVIGELDGGVSARVAALEDAWSRTGLEVLAVADVRSHEWAKQALQAAASPLAVATGLASHHLYAEPPLAAILVAVIREVAAVAAASGVELSPYEGYGFDVHAIATEPIAEAVARVRRRGEELIRAGKTGIVLSMLQDVRAGRRTEIEETAGHVVELARRSGLSERTLRDLERGATGRPACIPCARWRRRSGSAGRSCRRSSRRPGRLPPQRERVCCRRP